MGKFIKGGAVGGAVVLHGGTVIIGSYQKGRGRFTSAFFSNLNTVNLKFSPTMVCYTHEDKALTSLSNFGRSYPWGLGVKRCLGLKGCVMYSFSISFMLTLNWGTGILFEKLTPQIGGWIWKTLWTLQLRCWGFPEKPVFFFINFNGNLYFILWCLDGNALLD